jgi:hypothetical protein
MLRCVVVKNEDGKGGDIVLYSLPQTNVTLCNASRRYLVIVPYPGGTPNSPETNLACMHALGYAQRLHSSNADLGPMHSI